MLHDRQISEIAERIAKARIAGSSLERVLAAPGIDSEGKDAVRITVVLTPGGVEALTGDAVVDLLVELQRALAAEGEERLATIEYATEEELEEERQELETEADAADDDA